MEGWAVFNDLDLDLTPRWVDQGVGRYSRTSCSGRLHFMGPMVRGDKCRETYTILVGITVFREERKCPTNMLSERTKETVPLHLIQNRGPYTKEEVQRRRIPEL